MPDYDYKCADDHVTTIFRSIHDGPPVEIDCPLDGCELVAWRLYAAPVLVFDGSGHGRGHVSTKWAYQ